MGVRVLLIEDDETIAEPLADGLRHFGLTVHHVATGADGLRGPHGDVVLLDLGLPDMDGIDVCRGIRRTSDVPIIILSARGEEADRVLGLELGADDYLAKPFSIRELVARIRAVSRRHLRPGGGVAAGVVAGVVVAEEGVERGVGGDFGVRTGAGGDFGARAGVGGGAGVGFGASPSASVDAGSEAYAQRDSPTEELVDQWESASGGAAGLGGRSGRGFGAGFGAESDFSAASDFGTGHARGTGNTLGARNDFAVANDFAAERSSRVGDEGASRTGRANGGRGAGAGAEGAGHGTGADAGDGRARRIGFDAGADGSEYDWSAAYETPASGTQAPGTQAPGTRTRGTLEASAHADQPQVSPAQETPTRGTPFEGTPAHGTPTAPGNQAYGNALFGTTQGTPGAPGTPPQGSPMYGTPPQTTTTFGNPAYGTPPHGTPTYGTPAHGTPTYGSPAAYETPTYEPPVYEPPMYEQAPPGPRDSSGPGAAGHDGSAPPPPGPLVVDRRTRQVWVGEVPVALTPKEFELLALLTEDPGAVYSRQQILNRVWDDHYQGPTKTLDVHVATLRRKLGDPAWIQTLRGVGFRLAVRSPGQSPGQTNSPGQGQSQGRGRGRGPGSGRHRTSEARAS